MPLNHDLIDAGRFDEAVADALLDAGVSDGRIRLGVDIWPPKKAMASVLVLPQHTNTPAVFLLKTSWRERWKQFDRDAMLIEQNIATYLGNPKAKQCHIIALHYREYDRHNWNASNDIAEVQKKSLMFSPAITDALNVAQVVELDRIFKDIASY
jgi:hypothetical protein